MRDKVLGGQVNKSYLVFLKKRFQFEAWQFYLIGRQFTVYTIIEYPELSIILIIILSVPCVRNTWAALAGFPNEKNAS